MAKFDSKSFNPQAFGAYVNRIPNVKKNELAKSGAVGTNEYAKAALSSQTGSLYARIPYFGRIDGSTSQNNDGVSDITAPMGSVIYTATLCLNFVRGSPPIFPILCRENFCGCRDILEYT